MRLDTETFKEKWIRKKQKAKGERKEKFEKLMEDFRRDTLELISQMKTALEQDHTNIM